MVNKGLKQGTVANIELSKKLFEPWLQSQGEAGFSFHLIFVKSLESPHLCSTLRGGEKSQECVSQDWTHSGVGAGPKL